MVLTLKVPNRVREITGSPSWNVSAPVPSTLPLMVKPGASVSVNGPPVKLMAVPPPLIAPSSKTLPVPDMLIVPLTIPKLATVLCGLPVTVKAWLMTPLRALVIKLVPFPETVTPLLRVPALVMVFWLPVTLKVWLMVPPL